MMKEWVFKVMNPESVRLGLVGLAGFEPVTSTRKCGLHAPYGFLYWVTAPDFRHSARAVSKPVVCFLEPVVIPS